MSGNIHIEQDENIALVEADVIVNAANAHLLQGSGVCGAIFAQAGAEQLQQACDSIGHCKTGSAVMTPAFNLKAKFIAHAVGPKWFGGENKEPEQLRGAYQTALRLAKEYGCHSIAFPLLSAGTYKYPPEKAWAVAIEACRDFLKENPEWDMDIRFSIPDPELLRKGREELRKQTEEDAVAQESPEVPSIPVPQQRPAGFPELEEVLNDWYAREKKDPPYAILETILLGLRQDVRILVPVMVTGGDPYSLTGGQEPSIQIRNLTNADGTFVIPVFTSVEEIKKGEKTEVASAPLLNMMVSGLEKSSCIGIVINPWGNSYTLPVEVFEQLLRQAAPTEEEIALSKGDQAYAAGDYAAAAGFYLQAAEAGSAAAMSELGVFWYYGLHTAADPQKAKQYWEKAAILGQDQLAICRLGDLYISGEAGSDPAYARQLYLHAFALAQAAPDSRSFPEVCLRILRHCTEGLETPVLGSLAAAAVQMLESRASAGDSSAERLLTEARSFAAAYPAPQQSPAS